MSAVAIVICLLLALVAPHLALCVLFFTLGYPVAGIFAMIAGIIYQRDEIRGMKRSDVHTEPKPTERVRIIKEPIYLSEKLTAQDAYSVLGLNEGATHELISSAYRQMMARVHPDKGGSAYLAAKVNEARKVLLG